VWPSNRLDVALGSGQFVATKSVTEIFRHRPKIGEKPTLHELNHQKNLIFHGRLKRPSVTLYQVLPRGKLGRDSTFGIDEKPRVRAMPSSVHLKRLLSVIAIAVALDSWKSLVPDDPSKHFSECFSQRRLFRPPASASFDADDGRHQRFPPIVPLDHN